MKFELFCIFGYIGATRLYMGKDNANGNAKGSAEDKMGRNAEAGNGAGRKTPKTVAGKAKNSTSKQLIGFLLIGGIGAVIQLATVNILFLLLRDWKAPLPAFMSLVFNERTLGQGNANWGYLVPFFASNLLSNTYSYIHNMKGNFKTDAPGYCFAIYIALLAVLIVFATWASGAIANLVAQTGVSFFVKLAPTIGSILAGAVYTLILFPVEKYILFKERS